MKKIIFLFLMSSASFLAYGQGSIIRGVIVEREHSLPLAGVQISSTSGATARSDANGAFAIAMSPGDSLLFETDGYTPGHYFIQSKDAGRFLSITLTTRVRELEAVVVNNGYEVLPKERATGSYSQVDNAVLNEQISTDLLPRLEAVTSGLVFDRRTNQGKTTVQIRGISSIRGPKEPLIILDHFPYNGDISNINPNDVESVTVLKDAAATSIWGARAGNGVIVITTKKGRFNRKPMVSFTSNLSVTAAPDLHYLPNISSRDFAGVEQFLFQNGFRLADTASTERPQFSPVYEVLFLQRRGNITAARATAMIDSIGNHDVRDDFEKYMYRTAINSQQSVAVQGGSGNIAWRFAAGLVHNTGNLDNGYQRVNISSSNEFKLSQRLSLSSSLFYTHSNSTNGRTGYGEITTARGQLPPYTRLADEYGNAVAVADNYRLGYLDTAGGGKLLDWNYYPLTDYAHHKGRVALQNFTGAFHVQYQFFKAFSASLKYQYEDQVLENNLLHDEQSYIARSFINTYSQLNRQTGQVKYIVPRGAILDATNTHLTAQNLRGQLGYQRKQRSYELSAIAGGEVRDAKSNSRFDRIYGYNDDVLTVGKTDFLNSYPSFVNGGTNFIPNNAGFNRNTNRFVSGYINGGYSYQDRYHLTASARRDASNLFGTSANDQWSLLWSAGAGWDLYKEKFYHWKLVPFLKMRATYGKSGNIDPGMAAVTTIAYFSTSPYTGGPTAIFDKYNNPGLTWEAINTMNVGIDFKLRDDRVTGSAELYYKKGSNLYGLSPLDYTAVPTNKLVKNVAAMKGSGMDVELNTINTRGAIAWSSQLQWSLNRDQVNEYYLENTQGSLFLNGGNNISAIEGRPVYAVYSYRWAGLDTNTGDPLGYMGGVVSKDYNSLTGSATDVKDLEYHGRALPGVYGSVGNSVRYKGAYLSARISYKFDYYFIKSTIDYTSLFNLNAGHSDFTERWQQPGDELRTNVPSMIYPANSRRDGFYRNASVNVLKGDHIRFQYLTVGYELSELQLKRLPVKTINLFVNASNIGIIWGANKEGADPDYLQSVIPPPTTYALGLQVNFK